MQTKVKTTSHELAAQADQLHFVWEALINLAPRMRTALPAEMMNAKARLGNVLPDSGRLSGDYQLYAFYRLGATFQDRDRALTMGEISEALQVPLSSATRVVDWLVSTGYAERQSDTRDRRVVRVALTDAGSSFYRACNQFFGERIHEFLSHFTPTERRQLLTLAQKTIRVLEEMTS